MSNLNFKILAFLFFLFCGYISNAQNQDTMILIKWPDAQKKPKEVQFLLLNGVAEFNSFCFNSSLFSNLIGLSIEYEARNSTGGLKSPFVERDKNSIIIELSDVICKLDNLKSFRVYGFLIKKLPDCFYLMENLEDIRLEVDFDDFTVQSESFLKLKKLQNLKLIGDFTEEQNDLLYSIFPKNIKFRTY